MKKTKANIQPKNGSTVLVVLFVAILVLILAVGYFSNWKCADGEWVRSGFPLSGKPQGICETKQSEKIIQNEQGASKEISEEQEQATQGADKPEVSGLEVANIKRGDIVRSPLVVKGRAKGTWFFEGEFPIKLMDGKGNFFARGNALAQGEWMTRDWAPFEASLEFQNPTTSDGFLYFMKDNPSGLPQNDYLVAIPIKFAR
ncbi:MAG TPA: Gmad2 immunoglobulin-like domain-containing protein [Candidatus Bathyarchaeia archaeon]|nr:Gmad2 immunoglobulin-like domain-containing protein [Candidatus Bathyarchaeia archaeon]